MQTSIHLAAVSPWNEEAPVIHGPDIYGASAGKPFLFAIPTTGERLPGNLIPVDKMNASNQVEVWLG